MNYHKVYDSLINRGIHRIRNTSEYYEVHHIIPKCLGGDNSNTNLVKLTAREHFIAHLCLVRIHPNHHGLVMAAVMMTCSSSTQNRSGNRIYEWLRKKHQIAMSNGQLGEKNSQAGTIWVFNYIQKKNKKINLTELNNYIAKGWAAGRVMNFNLKVYKTCEVCGTNFRSSSPSVKTCSKLCKTNKICTFKVFAGREDELISHYMQTNSMNKSLKLMGYPGAVSHYYQWAKHILK